jgi:hypothetical protein
MATCKYCNVDNSIIYYRLALRALSTIEDGVRSPRSARNCECMHVTQSRSCLRDVGLFVWSSACGWLRRPPSPNPRPTSTRNGHTQHLPSHSLSSNNTATLCDHLPFSLSLHIPTTRSFSSSSLLAARRDEVVCCVDRLGALSRRHRQCQGPQSWPQKDPQ